MGRKIYCSQDHHWPPEALGWTGYLQHRGYIRHGYPQADRARGFIVSAGASHLSGYDGIRAPRYRGLDVKDKRGGERVSSTSLSPIREAEDRLLVAGTTGS
jgi:hypothetical protein